MKTEVLKFLYRISISLAFADSSSISDLIPLFSQHLQRLNHTPSRPRFDVFEKVLSGFLVHSPSEHATPWSLSALTCM